MHNLTRRAPAVQNSPFSVRAQSAAGVPPDPPRRDWVVRVPVSDLDDRINPLPPDLRHTLQVLEVFCRDKCYCWVSNRELQSKLGRSRRAVQLRLRRMVGEGLIARIDKEAGRPGRVGIVLLRRSDPDMPVADEASLHSAAEALTRSRAEAQARRKAARRGRAEPPNALPTAPMAPADATPRHSTAPMRALPAAPMVGAAGSAPNKTYSESDEVEEPTFNVGVAPDSSGPKDLSREIRAGRLINRMRAGGMHIYLDAAELPRWERVCPGAKPTDEQMHEAAELKPEMIRFLQGERKPSAGTQAERSATPARPPKELVREAGRIISSLPGNPDDSASSAAGLALVELFGDQDRATSQRTYAGLAEGVRNDVLPVSCLLESLDAACCGGIRNRGARFIDEVKRQLAALHQAHSQPAAPVEVEEQQRAAAVRRASVAGPPKVQERISEPSRPTKPAPQARDQAAAIVDVPGTASVGEIDGQQAAEAIRAMIRPREDGRDLPANVLLERIEYLGQLLDRRSRGRAVSLRLNAEQERLFASLDDGQWERFRALPVMEQKAIANGPKESDRRRIDLSGG